MVKTYNFARQNGLGKWGEGRVVKYLEGKGWKVTDVSSDKEYQKKGIDLLLERGEEEFSVDVKMDMLHHRTGNLFIETLSSDKSKTKGCALTSAADHFLFYDPFGQKLFFVNLKKIRSFYELNGESIAQATKKVKNDGYYTEGFVITPELLIAADIATVEELTEQVTV